ncbi:MAG TPA: hypothetical protein VGM39_09730 [Kofleriaceae bacterium]|jgi:hypothetical protein
MPKLTRIDTDDDIGTINDKQLKFLQEQLQEDREADEDHIVIDQDTLELLSDNGADPELLSILEKGLGDDEQMDVAWE